MLNTTHVSWFSKVGDFTRGILMLLAGIVVLPLVLPLTLARQMGVTFPTWLTALHKDLGVSFVGRNGFNICCVWRRLN